jgi:hypothetical protein
VLKGVPIFYGAETKVYVSEEDKCVIDELWAARRISKPDNRFRSVFENVLHKSNLRRLLIPVVLVNAQLVDPNVDRIMSRDNAI